MIKKLELKNFTVFKTAAFEFGKKLNIAIGANGSGKTHILKLLYAFAAFAAKKNDDFTPNDLLKTPQDVQAAKFDGFLGRVFKASSETLMSHSKNGSMDLRFSYEEKKQENHLVCQIKDNRILPHKDPADQLPYTTTTKISDYLRPDYLVTFGVSNTLPIDEMPLFLPTRELLSIYPHYASLAKKYQLPYDQATEDTIFALGMPPLKDDSFFNESMKKLYQTIEDTLGGRIYLGKDGNHFFLKLKNDETPMEINLVAEGWRKLGMIMVLLKNGSLLPGMTLFWDEPEANQNPALIRITASIITYLMQAGIQIFISTHSLFLLKELDMLTKEKGKFKPGEIRYFNFLKPGKVEQGNTPEDLNNILLLDESLAQSDRYFQMEE